MDADADSDSGSGSDGGSVGSAEEAAALAALAAAARRADAGAAAHAALVEALRAAGELERLRAAREAFAARVALAEGDWLAWVRDEARLGDAAADLGGLFARALEACPGSVPLWTLRLRAKKPAPAREDFARAARTAGLHVRDGAQLWTLWQKLEEDRGDPAALRAFVEERAQAPILDAGLKACMLRAGLESDAAEALIAGVQEQKKLAVAADAFERRILDLAPEPASAADAVPDGLADLWADYLDDMQARVRKRMGLPWAQRFVRTLFERAASACRETSPAIWEAYLDFCRLHLRDAALAEAVAERALLHCRASSALWCARLGVAEHRAAEEADLLIEQVSSITYRAIGDALPCQDLCDVLLASCHVYRRCAEAHASAPRLQEMLSKQFEYAAISLQTMHPADYAARVRVLEEYTRCLRSNALFTDAGPISDRDAKIAQLCDGLLEEFPNVVGCYMKVINICKGAGDLARCRTLYKRALHVAKSADEAATASSRKKRKAPGVKTGATAGVARAWEDFEARFGSIETLEAAQLQASRAVTLRERARAMAPSRAKRLKPAKRKAPRREDGEEKSPPQTSGEAFHKAKAAKIATQEQDDDAMELSGDDDGAPAAGEKHKNADAPLASEQQDAKRSRSERSAAEANGVAPGNQTDDKASVATGTSAGGTETESAQTKNAKRETERLRSIFVVNLSYKSTEEAIRDHFASCGKVARVLMKRNARGQFKGQCTVVYKAQPMAEAAFAQLQGVPLDGRALQLLEVKAPGDRRPQTRADASFANEVSAEQVPRTVHVTGLPPSHCSEEALMRGESGFAKALRACGDLEAVHVASNLASADVRFTKADAADRARATLDQKEFAWPKSGTDARPTSSGLVRVQATKTKYTAPPPAAAPAPAAGFMVPRALRTKQKKRLDLS